MVQRARLVSPPKWVKVHVCMMAQKNRNKKDLKGGTKNFFDKIFFRPKIFEKPLFLAIFGQKFDKITELAELNRRRDACSSAK